ncbi:MAG: glutamate dehydrogenase [Myxococcota bacterium]
MLRTTRSRFHVETRRLTDELSLSIALDSAPRFRPANGGTRFLPYASAGEAVADAYALCQHMRFKHNLYDTGFRGAKLVARGPVTADNKRALLDGIVDALHDYEGELYTGCDLNTTREDMERVGDRSPFVLAALGSEVDASAATGRGVAASFLSAVQEMTKVERWELSEPKSAMVHGCGATGSVVARALVDAGLDVYTLDLDARRADIPGCTNISDDPHWFEREVDALLPCSMSRLIDAPVASRLRCRLIVAAANDPLTEAAEATCDQRGIAWLPDPVSNAGAVIVDSVEHYAPHHWEVARAEEVYQFVEERTAEVTGQVIHEAVRRDASLRDVVESFADRACATPVGTHFYAASDAARPRASTPRPTLSELRETA